MGVRSEQRRRRKGQKSAFTIEDARLGVFSPVKGFGQTAFRKQLRKERKVQAQLTASAIPGVTFLEPGGSRGFVHKRILGAVGGFITGGPTAAIAGFARGGGGGSPQTAPQFAPGGLCFPPMRRDPTTGNCVAPFLGSVPGRDPSEGFLGGGGGAVMGQYGAAMVPDIDVREVRVCLPGMILGKDLNCYNKGEITNKQREWPKGRKPLGTPGEMAALAKAASFGRRMETTVKRMQKIGVLKKPSRGRRPAMKPYTAHAGDGVRVVNVE